jgi:hypothetical protein
MRQWEGRHLSTRHLSEVQPILEYHNRVACGEGEKLA